MDKKVIDRICSDLSVGVRPWLKPWSRDQAAGMVRALRHCGTPYKGINILVLWEAAEEHEYTCPRRMIYKQAQSLGGQIRKGETSSPVFNAGTFTKDEENPLRNVTDGTGFVRLWYR